MSACDIATGMYAHAAILEALLERERTGRGRGLEASLFSSMADWMTVPLLFFDSGSGTWPRVGLAHASVVPYGVYRLGCGADILIGIQNEEEFARFTDRILGRPELAKDPRFADNSLRTENRGALDELIHAAFSRLDRSSAQKELDAARIAFGFVNSVGELAAHPQLRRTRLETPSGSLELPVPPVTVKGIEPAYDPVPALGAHTEAVRQEFSR